MEGPREDVTGMVLAGGRSSRFGRDKAQVLIDGEPFLSRVANALAAACREVLVVAAPEQEIPKLSAPCPVRTVRDAMPYEGPLAGLIAGLGATRTEWAMVCTCDAPLVQSALLRLLCSKTSESVDAVTPLVEGRMQPFPALVRVRRLPELMVQFASGERRIGRSLESLPRAAVAEAELREADPQLLSFDNVNTPADLARLEAVLSDA